MALAPTLIWAFCWAPTLLQLDDLLGEVWVSLVLRDQHLLPVSGDTRLRTGDDVLVLADPGQHASLAAVFTTAAN